MIHRYRYSRFAIYKDRNNYDIGAALVRGYEGNGTNARLSKSGNFILPALQSSPRNCQTLGMTLATDFKNVGDGIT